MFHNNDAERVLQTVNNRQKQQHTSITVTLSVEENVFRFQVAVDDAMRVQVFNGKCNLGEVETVTKQHLTSH